MSFKPEFQTGSDPKWYSNAQAFETYDEAYASAAARYQVWTLATAFRAVESDEPVNYKWDNGDVPIRK